MSSSINLHQAEAPLILTLDIGTSSTRAMLYDRRARAVDEILVQVSNHIHITPDGGSEFDPDALLASTVETIDQVLRLVGARANQIAGVAVDTFVTNIMGLNASGLPVTPVYTYADTRSNIDAEALRQEFDVSTVHNRTGCLIHSAYLPARFRWLARSQPELLKSVAHWISIGEYLFETFFGRRVISYSAASWTGLLNRHKLTWDEDWFSALPIDQHQFSSLADFDQPLTGLTSEWADRWPVLKEVPWFPAIGDGAAANIGSGCDMPQKVALTIGTSGAMRVVLAEPISVVPKGLWLYRVDRQRALLGGATTEGGNVFAWLNDTLQLPPDVEQELARLEPAAHGLTILPFLAGERAPGWRGEARASLIGFTLSTRPIDILRAGLEAVAFRYGLIHQAISPHLPQEHQLIASGSGLLSSPTWLQIMADVLGHPIIASAEREATSRGVALLALESLGIVEDRPAVVGKTYQPRSDYHAQYQTALKKQMEAYNRLVVNPL